MELRDARVVDSPVRGRVRLVGTVRYETGHVPSEEYWLDLPARYQAELSHSGSCWLAFLLPLGAALGEPVRIGLPVDKALLANAKRLMSVWKAWYPFVSIVDVEAEVGQVAGAGKGRTGAFFSGGVDSFFTLLRKRDIATRNERRSIQDLITVHGFDIALENRAAFEQMRSRYQRIADAVGVELIDVVINLRSTRWRAASWTKLSHGACLAGIGLALEGRFDTVYIASGGGYRGNGLHPWGSHPVTDPLFSTQRTAIVYDAIEYLRTEKIEAIADAPTVHAALHPCPESRTDEPCGVCNKCLRTMLVLEVCGTLSRCKTFPPGPLLERIARMDCSRSKDLREFEDIRAFAVGRGRLDVARAIDQSVSRTKWRTPLRMSRSLAGRVVRRLSALARPK